MKKTQSLENVKRESYILEKRNVELVSFLTQTNNIIKKKQAKTNSFINNTKRQIMCK